MSPTRPSVLEILRLLPRSNCRECRLPTCMAFANQVAQGLREPGDCPYLDLSALDLGELGPAATPAGTDQEEILLELRDRIGQVDLAAVADAAGARLDGDSLVVSCLGRDFLIDNRGNLRSACHANFWVLIPLLDYVIRAASLGPGVASEPRGPWIKYDELGGGMSQSDFFSKSCEGALCLLHDEHPDLFPDLMDLFAAEHVDQGFDADLSVVLHPLPKVPLLVCYWEADPPFASKLSIYFDASTPARLSIEATIILIMGIVEMLKRIVTRHSFGTGSRKPQSE